MKDFNKSIQALMQSVMGQMERMQAKQFENIEKLTKRALLSHNAKTKNMQQPTSTGFNINSSNVVNIANEKMHITSEFNSIDDTRKRTYPPLKEILKK